MRNYTYNDPIWAGGRCESIDPTGLNRCDGGWAHYGGHAHLSGTKLLAQWPTEGFDNCTLEGKSAFCYTDWRRLQDAHPNLAASALLRALEAL